MVARSVTDQTAKTPRGFVEEVAKDDAVVYTDTDEAGQYKTYLGYHESVNHNAGEYVRGQAHTNGVESFWSMLIRGYYGTYHQFSVKHLDRYINEFSGRHNSRPLDTIDQMGRMADGMVGKRLRYQDLTGRSVTRG